jgi:hypothetical protein
VAYGARLESVLGASPRGFESLSLRQSALTRTLARLPCPRAFEQGQDLILVASWCAALRPFAPDIDHRGKGGVCHEAVIFNVKTLEEGLVDRPARLIRQQAVELARLGAQHQGCLEQVGAVPGSLTAKLGMYANAALSLTAVLLYIAGRVHGGNAHNTDLWLQTSWYALTAISCGVALRMAWALRQSFKLYRKSLE